MSLKEMIDANGNKVILDMSGPTEFDGRPAMINITTLKKDGTYTTTGPIYMADLVEEIENYCEFEVGRQVKS